MEIRNLLVVSEDTETAEQIRLAIGAKEYNFFHTESGVDAIRLLRKKVMDVIIISLALSDISCPAFLQQAFKINPSSSSIVLCKQDESNDTLIQCYKAGAQGILSSTFSTQEIKKVINEVVQKNHLAKENMKLGALESLVEANKSIVSGLNENRLFASIVRMVCIETRADKASLMLMDKTSDELVIKAALGLSKDIINKRIPLSEDKTCWTVIKTRKAMLLNARAVPETGANKSQIISSLCVPLITKGQVIGVLHCTKNASRTPFTECDVELLSILAGQAATAIENVNLLHDVKQQRNNVEVFLRKCLTAQEDERRRISTELHDGLAQWMSSASYAVQLSDAHLEKADIKKAREEIATANEIIRKGIKELRRVILDLHPTVLAQLGLIGALRQIIAAVEEETSCKANLIIAGDPTTLTPIQEIAIYRVVSEAINNVRRHAGASLVEAVLSFEHERITVDICDNGIGFDLEDVRARHATDGNIGLVGMRERAEMVGGDLDITTALGQGTHILFKIPLTERKILCNV